MYQLRLKPKTLFSKTKQPASTTLSGTWGFLELEAFEKNNKEVPQRQATSSHRNRTRSSMTRILSRPDNGNYCWSHGYVVADDHMSCTCNKKKGGHIKDARRQNPQGGSKRGKAERGLWRWSIMHVEHNNNQTTMSCPNIRWSIFAPYFSGV
jgi:hypothetical protein